MSSAGVDGVKQLAKQASVTLRTGEPKDAESLGRVFWDAFSQLAARHAMPCEPSSPEFTTLMAQRWLSQPGVHCVVAVRDATIIGGGFMDERSAIAGIGPVMVDPAAQSGGTGRQLMRALLDRAADIGAVGVRLVQTAYNYHSLALYARLGFTVREPLSVMAGPLRLVAVAGCSVRAATVDDVASCNALARAVHGHDRGPEVVDAVAEGIAMVVERDGMLTGYATGLGYASHAVATTSDDLCALIGSRAPIRGLGILVPSRDSRTLGWCLDRGLRIVQQSTLMATGLYAEPSGAYLPSILY